MIVKDGRIRGGGDNALKRLRGQWNELRPIVRRHEAFTGPAERRRRKAARALSRWRRGQRYEREERE